MGKFKNKIFSILVVLLLALNIICPSVVSAQESYKSSKSKTISLGVYSDVGPIYESLEVEYRPGDTAYTLLKRVLGNKVVAEGSGETIYVQGIDGLFEFDRGSLSGWNYAVNRWMPNYSAGIYDLKPGDEMIWHYTVDLGRDIQKSYDKFDKFIEENTSNPGPNPPTPPVGPENEAPTIVVSDQTLKVGDKFNPIDIVSAYDSEDGNITDKVKIIRNELKLDDEGKVLEKGKHNITYKVTDSDGSSTEKTITVNVNEAELIKSELVGDSRYTTATKVSNRGWDKSDNIVLVNSGSIVDALSATPFAKMKNAPILLTDSKQLNEETKKEIIRLKGKNVYIIGGNGAVSDSVELELNDMGLNTDRISGDDRYKTSLEIAKKLENISEVAVVNGVTGLSDAVSIAPVAASENMPIILASPQDGVKTFEDYIKNNNIKTSYVIGGKNAVSNELEKQLKNPVRLSGKNRNQTNAKIVEKFYTEKEINNLFIAKDGMKNQNGLIDALSAGVLASKEKSPIFIVGNELDKEQERVLMSKTFKEVTKVGGNGNENAFNQIVNLLGK